MNSLRIYLPLLLFNLCGLIWIWGVSQSDFGMAFQSIEIGVLALLAVGAFLTYLIPSEKGGLYLALISSWWFSLFVASYLFINGRSVLQTSLEAGLFSMQLVLWGGFLYLCHAISCQIEKLERTIFDLGGGVSISAVDNQQSLDLIRDEMMRSRYSGNPLSVISIDATYDSLPELDSNFFQAIYQRYQNQFHRAEVSRWVSREVRLIDYLFRNDQEDQIILLCPVLDKEEADHLCQKVANVLENERGLKVVARSATYPVDGITFDGLLKTISNEKDGSLRSGVPSEGGEDYDLVVQSG